MPETGARQGRACEWPYCLTDCEGDQLAHDILQEMAGHHVPVRPDPAKVCGCTPETHAA